MDPKRTDNTPNPDSSALAEMLSMASVMPDDVDSGTADPRSQQLEELLDAPFQPRPQDVQGLAKAVEHLQADRKSVLELLIDPAASLEYLFAIKAQAKEALQSPDPALRDAATVVYYGAIAGGLLHCDTAISALSWKQQLQGIEKILSWDWISPGMRDLLKRADTQIRERLDG